MDPEPTRNFHNPFKLDNPYLKKDDNPHYTCVFKNSAIHK